MHSSTEENAALPRTGLWLWAAMFGPPVVWLIQFQVKYSLAARTTAGVRMTVVAASIVALIAVTACGLMASRYHRIAGESPLDRFAGKVPRIRFMATLGMLFSGLFFLVIVAQLLAELFIKPGLQ